MVQILVDSFLLVLVSEFGDKTQLMALLLAARFKRPWIVMSGILFATLLNHGLAAFFGSFLAGAIPPNILTWGLGIIFIVFGLWILKPDKDEKLETENRYGPFWTTVVVFFLAEMGDKTQLATIALGAKFDAPILVTTGTTCGMLVADGLAVFLGDRLMRVVPMKWIRAIASALFILFGLAILLKF